MALPFYFNCERILLADLSNREPVTIFKERVSSLVTKTGYILPAWGCVDDVTMRNQRHHHHNICYGENIRDL